MVAYCEFHVEKIPRTCIEDPQPPPNINLMHFLIVYIVAVIVLSWPGVHS